MHQCLDLAVPNLRDAVTDDICNLNILNRSSNGLQQLTLDQAQVEMSNNDHNQKNKDIRHSIHFRT